MKRTLVLLALVLMLLLPMTTGHASFDELKESAISNITEVHGYLYEEIEGFIFEDTQTDEAWGISYWHKDHPEWVYSMSVNKIMTDVRSIETPFDMPIGWSYGENGVRDALRAAEQNSWFSCWTKANQSALLQTMDDNHIPATTTLSAGIANGSITAQQAVYEFFVSCYGDDITWNDATKQWREFILTSNNLTPVASVNKPIKGVRTYLSKVDDQTSISYTDFYQETPAELKGVFSQPQFADWTCLTGSLSTVSTSSSASTRKDYGLVIFEKDSARQLIVLYRAMSTDAWQAFYMGDQMLYTGRDVLIQCEQENRYFQNFTIEYPISDTKTEIFEVSPYIHLESSKPVAHLRFLRYSANDRQTGEGVIIKGSGAAGARYISVTTKAANEPVIEQSLKGKLPEYFDYFDMATFPTSAKECMEYGKILDNVLPEGYGICSNVHLRARTSSLSKDLGLYNYGTLVKVLEILPGDPYSWVKVEIGSVTGYMSGSYVRFPGTEGYSRMDDQLTLPAASANKDTVLKKGTNLLSGKVTDIPAGTKMHVLATKDKWLHVSIPSEGKESDSMDIQGTDGYIWAEDVTIASSMSQLTWTQ